MLLRDFDDKASILGFPQLQNLRLSGGGGNDKAVGVAVNDVQLPLHLPVLFADERGRLRHGLRHGRIRGKAANYIAEGRPRLGPAGPV